MGVIPACEHNSKLFAFQSAVNLRCVCTNAHVSLTDLHPCHWNDFGLLRTPKVNMENAWNFILIFDSLHAPNMRRNKLRATTTTRTARGKIIFIASDSERKRCYSRNACATQWISQPPHVVCTILRTSIPRSACIWLVGCIFIRLFSFFALCSVPFGTRRAENSAATAAAAAAAAHSPPRVHDERKLLLLHIVHRTWPIYTYFLTTHRTPNIATRI